MEQGDIKAYVSIFIFRNDSLNADAWALADSISAKLKSTRNFDVFLHICTDKAVFLNRLRQWNDGLPAHEGYLVLNAHMGQYGLGPTSSAAPSDAVSWAELRSALPKGLSSAWFLGCESAHVLNSWGRPSDSPVKDFMLCTVTSQPWRELLECVDCELTSASKSEEIRWRGHRADTTYPMQLGGVSLPRSSSWALA